MSRRKVAVFTGNRAEYGLLHPVIGELSLEPSLEVYLIISGSHLSDNFGRTVSEIYTSFVKKVKKLILEFLLSIKQLKFFSLFL